MRAMLRGADIENEKLKYEVWAECANIVAQLDNILLGGNRTNSPYFQFYQKHPRYFENLRTFGEMRIATMHENKKIRGKLDPRGKLCMFVGYPTNTTGDTFRMLNIQTKKIIKSKDIVWLKMLYGEYKE